VVREVGEAVGQLLVGRRARARIEGPLDLDAVLGEFLSSTPCWWAVEMMVPPVIGRPPVPAPE
jgi:hypothetical protein